MIDLEREADEAEIKFIVAARTAHTEEEDFRAQALLHEYLNVLKLMRLKRVKIGG